MANNNYAHYSIGDFDKFNCLKLSLSFYLMLAFILRGYVIWLMSVTNMNDHVGALQWVYPQRSLFYLSLLSGALGLLILVVISLRRPNAATWVKWCWHRCRYLLLVALSVDFIINYLAYYFWQGQSLDWIMVHSVLMVIFVFTCFKNKKLRINLSEFPEERFE